MVRTHVDPEKGFDSYVSREGWDGIPWSAFLYALVGAASLAGLSKVAAYNRLVVNADGIDAFYEKPLVRITKGTPSGFEMMGRVLAAWEAGWEATVRMRYDPERFTLEDVFNLLARAGMQVGIGEGRPGRPDGGCGYGTFEVLTQQAGA